MLPNSASEFWSRLSPRSSGNRRVSDSTACIKKPVNPSTDKDTTEFVPTSSGDQIHRSKILETNSNSTSSSGMDHQARASGSPLVLDSPAKASGSSLKTSRSTLVSGIPVKASGSPVEASGSPVGASGSPVVLGSPVGATSPPAKGTRSPARISDLESLCPSPQKIKETLAPHVGTHEQSIEIEAQKRLVVPANVPIFSNKSRAGKERDPLVCDNATSMHNGHRESTPTSFLDIVDNLQCPQNTGNPKPAGSISPASRNPANTDTGWHSGFLPADSRRHLPTPSEPSQISEDNKSPSSAKATSHPSQPLSITPPTAPKSHRVQHLKSHSAEASEFHPRLPPTGPKNHRVQHLKSYSAEAPIYRPMLAPSMPTTPTCTYGNGHRRSASIKMMQSNPSFSSPRRTRPRRQPRVGTPSFSGGSGRFQNPGPPHLLTGSHYPAPRQHTPQGQGQYFATSGSTPYQMATQIRQPVDRNMAPLPSPMFPSSMPPSDFGTPRINAHGYGQDEENVEYSQINHFDSYATPQAASAAPNGSEPQQNGSIYTQDTNGYGPTYYTNHTDPTHQLKHNLYTPLEPHREPSKLNQRTAKDLFIPEDIRLKLHARTEATLRVFAVTNIPAVEPYHTLTPLTSLHQQPSHTLRGHISTTYKAVSANDGRTYCLRRIHDYRATYFHEAAIQAVRKSWKSVKNSNVVALHLAFTTSKFNDHSLIIVSDYHPDSKTIAEKHFSQTPGRSNRNPFIPEQIMWSYVVQITNALKAVHSAKLAVRVIEPNKVILTDEDRIRLNGCALDDVLDNEAQDVADLQRQDFLKFGKFILAVGTNNMSNHSARANIFAQQYYKTSPQLKTVIEWLLDHDRPHNHEGIDALVNLISSRAFDAFNDSLRSNDHLYFHLNKEMESSRIVRLLTKINCLNERPEHEHDRTYSAQGPRAVLGLFRDYVFHQIDAQANPVVDMGHILSCLNKLDAGIEERITLTARDEQSVIVVSYKELKGALEGTWQELVRRST